MMIRKLIEVIMCMKVEYYVIGVFILILYPLTNFKEINNILPWNYEQPMIMMEPLVTTTSSLRDVKKNELANTNFLNSQEKDLTFGIVVGVDYSTHDTISANTIEKKEEVVTQSNPYLEEAKTCVRKAKKFAENGNRKIAFKLFKHAIALCPKYIDALNEFGAFLENENIVEADLMYERARSTDPNNANAIANRKRTAPEVAEHDLNVFMVIDSMKRELYKYSAHHPSLRNAMKEFYYHHIYHTVAIEGNTLTVEEIKEIIDKRKAVVGKSIMEHNEVIGVAEALKYMNNTLLMKVGNISIGDIKSLHKRVLGFNDPILAGEFRVNQVFVGGHIPPNPNDVDLYMEQFEEWLNSPEVLQLHPVEYAAIAHYRLVYIHPFVDGNGRTARLLMNFILMKNGFPPVSIEIQDRQEYYDCLRSANDGDLRPFIRFIARCTTNMLEDYLVAAEMPYIHMQNPSIDQETYYHNEL